MIFLWDVPREESFPIPLKYIDVARTTSLDVMLEKKTEDYWNVDGDRELSDMWTGFIRFKMLNEKPPDGSTWSGERLTRKRLPGQTPCGQRFGKICPKLKEKQKWAIEKPKLDNARRLRGIDFIDPDDEEFKNIMKNARGKLEGSMSAAMPCKLQR